MYSLEYFEQIFNKYSESSLTKGEFAIMAPLVISEGEVCLLFEVRAMNMRRQPGEVCFPGGKIEKLETPEECAVRETAEELGISAERIKTIGNLGYMYSLLNERVDVIVGEILDYERLGVNKNPDEVHKVFVVPLDFFMNRGRSDAFNFDGNYIWGLTARAVNKIIKLSEEGL